MVPVNLRPLEDAWKLGHRFGLAPLTLPIGIANPIERVYAVRLRMNQLKDSYRFEPEFEGLLLMTMMLPGAEGA